MKVPVRAASFFAAILCWILLSVLTVFIGWSMRDRARLIRDNENEQLFNLLFTGLRNYEDFGSAIEANPALGERITGFAVYGNNLTQLYSWGKVPPVFDENLLKNQVLPGRFGRYTIPDRRGDSVKFILQYENFPPPLPSPQTQREGGNSRESGNFREGGNSRQRQWPIIRQGFPFFNTLAQGRYYYIDIYHPAYWRTLTFTTILLPLCCIALLAAALYIRRLYLRNREYRERIEGQKNLVVLGTAAGTLAHEIKNPLSSIRLQTGILRKIFADQGQEEIALIEEEVDRLSELTYRVNDYLREAAGNPQPLNVRDLLAETGQRLCGRNILGEGSVQEAWVKADPERLRSVFENVIRNALEAGGPSEEVSAAISHGSGTFLITVNDRGTGIAEADRQHIFDPFFTKKSTGTGIGLSISKRFVEAAGGKIDLENREGGGAQARITLSEYEQP